MLMEANRSSTPPMSKPMSLPLWNPAPVDCSRLSWCSLSFSSFGRLGPAASGGTKRLWLHDVMGHHRGNLISGCSSRSARSGHILGKQ